MYRSITHAFSCLYCIYIPAISLWPDTKFTWLVYIKYNMFFIIPAMYLPDAITGVKYLGLFPY